MKRPDWQSDISMNRRRKIFHVTKQLITENIEQRGKRYEDTSIHSTT